MATVRSRTGGLEGYGSSRGTLIPGSALAVTGDGALIVAGEATEVGSVRVSGEPAGGEERQPITAVASGDRTQVMRSVQLLSGTPRNASIAEANTAATDVDGAGAVKGALPETGLQAPRSALRSAANAATPATTKRQAWTAAATAPGASERSDASRAA